MQIESRIQHVAGKRLICYLGPVHTYPFANENGAVLLRILLLVDTTTPKTITENGVIRKRSPERSDLKTMLFENAVS